jgi:chromosome segregation ATPase
MPMTVALHRKLEEVDPQLRGVLFAILEEIEQQREETVTKREFNELRDIVGELAEAQRQTEKRVSELAEAQKQLAEAQRQTENRLSRLEVVVSELAEAQKQLAEAQKQTENRLSRLEVVVSELAEAQKQAENRLSRVEVAIGQLTASVKNLVDEQAKTRDELTGLTTTVGFALEDRAYKSLPALLQQEFGLEVQGKLERKYVTDKKGEQIEVNIIGEATRNGDRFVIIGECKSQLSRNKIEAFLRKKLKRLEGVFQGEIFPIIVTYMISQPDAAKFALQQGIKRVYYSHEF